MQNLSEDEAFLIYERFLLTNDDIVAYNNLLNDVNFFGVCWLYKDWLDEANKYYSLSIDNLPLDIKNKLIAIAIYEEDATNRYRYYEFFREYIKSLAHKLKLDIKDNDIFNHYEQHAIYDSADKYIFDIAKSFLFKYHKEIDDDFFISNFNYTRYMKLPKCNYEADIIIQGEYKEKINDYIYRQWLIKLKNSKYIDNVISNQYLTKIIHEYL